MWTMRQALFCLIGSTCATLVVFVSFYGYWIYVKRERLLKSEYLISSIVQTGPEKEALKTAYLAELLDLSIDRPTNLFAFDLQKGEQKLLKSPLIAKASLKRLSPNRLYVDYEVRKPIARLGDYQNIGIDKEGYIFPIEPFFPPKELPELYLGLPPFGENEDVFGRKGGLWLSPLKNKHLDLGFELIEFLMGFAWKEGLRIKKIDVSNAFAPSLGRREIVLFTEEELLLSREDGTFSCVFPKILRLSPKEYIQQMNNFLGLQKNMRADYRQQLSLVAPLQSPGRFSPRTIDLRIPHLAIVQK